MSLKDFIDKHPLAITLTVIVLTASITSGIMSFLYEKIRIPTLIGRINDYEIEIEQLKSEAKHIIIQTNVITNMVRDEKVLKVDRNNEIVNEIKMKKDEYVDRYAKYQNEPSDESSPRFYGAYKKPTPEEKAKEEEINGIRQEAKVFVENIQALAESINDTKTLQWCKERFKRL